ncbi:MAG: hypothetical protein JWQ40_2749 [Segetibacter sp.]|nr:hypothetical protein [Segetibacter sp.]
MIIFLLLSLLFIIGSTQPLLMAFAIATVFVIYKFFWKRDQPKVIFFGLVLFWLTIIVKLFYADFIGISFTELSISPNIIQTAYVAMAALNVFAVGIFLITRSIKEPGERSIPNADAYDTKKIMFVYLASIVFKTVLGSIGSFGFGEVFKALLLLRSGLIFVLLFVYYKKTNNITIPLILILIEVVLSFFSFFSNFKDIIISFIVAFTFFPLKLKGKQFFFMTVVSFGCLYLLLIWQAVKGDYRSYLSGGQRSQAVVVERDEALGRFYDLASSANINDSELWYESIDRLSYIEFFSEATDNVPSVIPFEKGALWKQNILHVLVPRILYPKKKAIYDSEMVNKYATRKVAGADVGVSFSLGFLAESYIDYGYVFMFVPVFLLGVFFGLIYRSILNNSLNYIWGCAFVSPLWVYFNCNGTPGAKILGWMIFYFIVYYIVNRYLIKKLDNYLKVQHATKPAQDVILNYG